MSQPIEHVSADVGQLHTAVAGAAHVEANAGQSSGGIMPTVSCDTDLQIADQ